MSWPGAVYRHTEAAGVPCYSPALGTSVGQQHAEHAARHAARWLSGFHLSCPRARSTLFLDPMLLRCAPDPGAVIAIAIPVEAGRAGRWGAAVAR